MHQLIILGNGFDLACGLKSKFSQFFGNRTNGTFSYESIPEDERNIWDFILAEVGESDPLWCDIESLISAYVLETEKQVPRLTACTTRRLEPLIRGVQISHSIQSRNCISSQYNLLGKMIYPSEN